MQVMKTAKAMTLGKPRKVRIYEAVRKPTF
jgi:hypothetical protein